MAKDYYEVLGVTRTASADEIKRAYRRMAHKYHPDKDHGDEERFKEVNEAYQVLSDQQKRTQYDQFGQTFEGGGENPFGGGFSGFNVNFEDAGPFSDIFEQFFGGARGGARSRAVRRGQDIGVDITLSFIESANPTTRDLQLRLFQTCEHCHGNGAEPGTPINECTTCKGAGTIDSTRQSIFGMVRQATVCPDCQGEGKRPKKVCQECRGEGRTKKDITLAVEVPAGIADGQTIRLTGKGEVPARGGVAGDLYVTVHVTPHSTLQREGNDVTTTVAVSFADAALGTKVSVDTLTGKEQITVAPGTQPGTRIVLDNQGFPSVQGRSKGNEVVTVQVEIPKKLSRQQHKLLEEYKKTHSRKGIFG